MIYKPLNNIEKQLLKMKDPPNKTKLSSIDETRQEVQFYF
jgi:hypothetical protein